MNGNLKEVNHEEATLNDWAQHLSTIFTEVRLKQYLEIRPADSCSWAGVCSIPAFWTGVLYNNEILDECYNMFKKWTYLDVNNAYIDAGKYGMKAKLYDKELSEHAKIFLQLSKKGLQKRNQLNSNNDDESVFLEELHQFAEKGKNLSNSLIDDFDAKYKDNVNLIFDEKAF